MEPIDRSLIKRLQDGRMTRREFIVAAAAAGVSLSGIAGILASCAPTPTATAVPVAPKPAGTAAPPQPVVTDKLRMKLRSSFITEGNEVLKVVAQQWGKENGVSVEVDLAGMGDLQTIAGTAAETGAGPDIVEVFVNTPHVYAEKLEDMSDVANELGAKFGGWYDLAKEACVPASGKWIGLPRFYAAHCIVYRADLFKQVGHDKPAETWDELLAIGKKLKEKKLPPLGFALAHAVGDGSNFVYSMLWSFGGREVDKDGKTVVINSAETAKAIDFVRTLFQETMTPAVLQWTDAENNRAFVSGEVAVTNNASSIWWQARNVQSIVGAPKNAVDLFNGTQHALYPAGPAGRLLFTEMMSSIVFSYSKNVDAAKAFLRYLNDRPQMDPWVQANLTFCTPLLKGYEELPLMPWNSIPPLRPFKAAAQYGHLPGYPSTNGRAAGEAFNKWIVHDMFAKACTGTSTKDAIVWAEEQLKKIYK